MKTYLLTLIAAVGMSFGMVSCASGPNAQRGTVIGGLGGAAVGGIIGSQSGRGLEGAAIGAGLGALAGNSIGDSHDRRYYNNNGYGYRRGGYYNNGYNNGYRRGYYNNGYGY